MTEIITEEIKVEVNQVQNTVEIAADKIVNIYNNATALATAWGDVTGDIQNQIDLKTKLEGITDSISTAVNLLNTALDAKQNLLEFFAENQANKGVANGYASLNEEGKIPQSQLDSFSKTNSDWEAISGPAQILNKPTFSMVAVTGSYLDLSNKPNIPSAQVSSDWNSTTGASLILNKPTIPTLISQLTNDSSFLTNNLVSSVAGRIGEITLTSSDVGLDNVPNIDTTNPVNIAQSANYRFTTDTEKAVWSSKQSALGYTPFNKAGDTLTATNGTGLIGLPAQSTTPSTPSSGFRLFANSSNAFSWLGQNGFTRTFDGTNNTSDRTYILPNSSGNIVIAESIPNGALINGVCWIVGNTKPTVRPGINSNPPSNLVIGDKWYNPSTGLDFFWNGTYFLGAEKTITFSSTNTLSATSSMVCPVPTNLSILIRRFDTSCLANTTLNSVNYFGVTCQLQNSNNTQTNINSSFSFFINSQAISTSQVYSSVASVFADMSNYRGFRVLFSRIGSATANLGFTIRYQEVQ